MLKLVQQPQMPTMTLNVRSPPGVSPGASLAGPVVSPNQNSPPLTLTPQAPRVQIVPEGGSSLPGAPSIQARPKGRSVTDYLKLSHREQIYLRPDMYIGSDEQIAMEEWIFDLKVLKMVKKNITFPFAIRHLFLEGLCNATDNAEVSRRSGVNPGSIAVRMDKKMIVLRNGGIPMPIEIHPKHNMWGPDLILGTLLTSSNYQGVQTGIGKNGYGAKLINIFSKFFKVEVGDPIHKRHYVQEWKENMTLRGEPQITEGYTGESFVEITYVLDFLRFGYMEYPEEAFELIARHCVDSSFTSKIPVSFNGVNLYYPKITDYRGLFFSPDTNYILHYEWAPGTETREESDGLILAVDPLAIPTIELCLIDTPHEGEIISFINGLMTKEGGVHVDAAMKAITAGVLSELRFTRKDGAGGKKGNKRAQKKAAARAAAKGKGRKERGKDKDKDKKKTEVKLTMQDVRPHTSIIVSCWVTNPKFTSQNKVNFTGPAVHFHIPVTFYYPIGKWKLAERLYYALEAKKFHKLAKTDGKGRRPIGSRGERANFAGKAGHSRQCTLYAVEGKSAMGYAVNSISLVPNGRNYIGVFPMKGKPLNVMNADVEQIADNEEILDLKKALNLKEGVDYTLEENFNTLYYGHFVILADSDDDGKHIIGLILNLFHCRFPSLLARGFVKFLRTPILRMTKGKTVVKFYTHSEFEAWKATTPDWNKWTPKYFKGLGTSTKEHVADDFKTPRVVQCVYDNKSPAAFRLAFDAKLADERKVWLATWRRLFEVEAIQMLPISEFIDQEFIEYSVANLRRSIPRLMDGLKRSQRKAIFAAYKKWSSQGKPENGITKKAKEIKVAQFANYAAEKSGYHHGERCMEDTIMTMALDIVGSNNLPYFTRDGQFGTRNFGGEDAASSRYTYTRPEWWLNYIYRKEDYPLLTFVNDDNKVVEPMTYLPILPMALVNGVQGIGTGHSTFIPPTDPLNCSGWLRARIQGTELPELKPWYRNFKGEIEVVQRPYRPPRKLTNRNGDVAVGATVDAAGVPVREIDASEIDTRLNLVIVEEESDDDDDDKVETSEEARLRLQIVPDPSIPAGPKGPPRLSMVTRGIFTTDARGDVWVSELPIGRWTHDYFVWLEELLSDKEISDNNNLSTDEEVRFKISGFKNPTLKNLRLENRYGMTNMVLLDINDNPVTYTSLTEIIETFYQQRLPYYEMRRQSFIASLSEEIEKKELKIRFIQAVIDGKIQFIGRSKTLVYPQMDALGLPHKLLTSTSSTNYTAEEIVALQAEIRAMIERRRSYTTISAAALWLADLDEFEKAYCRYYKCPLPGNRVLPPTLVVENEDEEAPAEANDE